MVKKKIALCLCGHIGSSFSKSMLVNQSVEISLVNLELSYAHIFNDIINCNKNFEFDIFIHSWSNEIKEEIIVKFKPKKYYIESIKLDKNREKFESIKLDKKNKKLNAHAISRLLGIKIVLNLMKEYVEENKIFYEQVIMCRFDLVLTKPFPLNSYINNNIKILDGLNRKNKKSPYDHKHYNDINNRLKIIKKVDFTSLEVKIIDVLFMSSYENMIKFANYYDKLIDVPIWKSHCFCLQIIIDILKGSKNKIEIIKELYFELLKEGDQITKEYTVLLLKQVYFRNPGVNMEYGTLKGDINCRLLDIRNLLEKYNIDENIIKKCI
jgi:hypothetical protein